MMPPIMASISRKSSNKGPLKIFQMLFARRRTDKNKLFLWVRGGFYGFRLWEVKMLWVRVMGVTLVQRAQITTHRIETEDRKPIETQALALF